MPLYEYRCTRCGHHYEKIQSFSSTPDVICPECGGPVERPLNAPAFSFKGAGWYVNDYAARPKASAGPADSTKPGEIKAEASPAAESKTPGTESTAKSEGKSDSKPATTPSTSSGSGTAS